MWKNLKQKHSGCYTLKGCYLSTLKVESTSESSRLAAEAARRSAVPWGVMGNACGMPEPVFCVVKYFHELKFSGGPWFLVVFHRVCEALHGAVVTVVC